jgi:hypothetical protein
MMIPLDALIDVGAAPATDNVEEYQVAVDEHDAILGFYPVGPRYSEVVGTLLPITKEDYDLAFAIQATHYTQEGGLERRRLTPAHTEAEPGGLDQAQQNGA